MYETIDHLIITAEENNISEAELTKRNEQINKGLAILNSYINYLKKAKDAGTENHHKQITINRKPK